MGEGTYAYECNDPKCKYCELMGLKPMYRQPAKEPVEIVAIPIPLANNNEDAVFKLVNSDLTPYQRKKIRYMGVSPYHIANYKMKALR